MVEYVELIRYQPGFAYPATDAAILADALQARLVATVFYRTDLPTPAGGRKGFLDIQGGGAQPASGLPTTDFPLGDPNADFRTALYQQGHAIVSLGYVVGPTVGGAPPSPANEFIWYATGAALDAAIPGRTAFDPSQWKYAGAGGDHVLQLDEGILGRYSAEHCVVHLSQWIAQFGNTIGLSQDLEDDWVIGGRSFGAHLAQFVGLGPNRADPAATPGTRFAQSTRYRAVFCYAQSVSSFNVNVDEQGIPHWTDYAGGLLVTIGAAKATTGPSSEDQIALASALYFADKGTAQQEANAITPVFQAAANAPLTHTGYTYADLDGIAPDGAPHNGAVVTGMQLLLQGLTPPSGSDNVHTTQSVFLVNPGPVDVVIAQIAFILPFYVQDEEPEPVPIGGQASTVKGSTIDVVFSWSSHMLSLTRQTGGFSGYTVVPDLSVRIPFDAPGIVQEPCIIDLPDTVDLARDLAEGIAYPEIDVVIVERRFDTAGTQYESRVLWAGHVDVAKRNPRGRSGRVELECVDELSKTEGATMGIGCDAFCKRTFGRGLCRSAVVKLEVLEQTGQVQAINGTTVTIAGLTPGAYPTYYRNGYVEFDGLKISVRNWSADAPTVFVLREEPPAAWLLANVAVYPGCDHTPANCTFYGNQARFLGPGLVMPEYAPNYEQPPT